MRRVWLAGAYFLKFSDQREKGLTIWGLARYSCRPMNPRTPRNLSHKLALYSLGVGAASLASAAKADFAVYSGPDVDGGTIHFDLQNSIPPASNTTGTLGHDFELQSKTSKSKAKIYNEAGSMYSSSVLFTNRTGTGPNMAVRPYALRLNMGDTIGGVGQTFGTYAFLQNEYVPPVGSTANPGYGLGDWEPGDRGFLALRLTIGGSNYYGWADVTLNNLNGNAPGVFTLHGYAFDLTPGEPTTAGQVPEPGTVALLVAGAAGMVALKKRRKK
jgi:PEP-CTERM motif-containing protein